MPFPKPKYFIVETNRLLSSAHRFVRWLLLQPDVAVAHIIPGHLTTVRIEGPTTRRMVALLQAKLHPRRGSALILRSRGGSRQLLLLTNRGNRRLQRLA